MHKDNLRTIVDDILFNGMLKDYSYKEYRKLVNWYIEENKNVCIQQYYDNGRFFIVGDLHGDFNSLLYILRIVLMFNRTVQGEKARIIFLGDYIDRGPRSFDVLVTLLLFSCAYPGMIMLLRGNHEDRVFCDGCTENGHVTLKSEMMNEYGENYVDLYDLLTSVFDYMTIACKLPNAYCIHGGVPTDIDKFMRLSHSMKPFDIHEKGNKSVMSALWNDPMDDDNYERGIYGKSVRGDGICTIGKAPTKEFLQKEEALFIVRGHQVPTTPFRRTPDNRVITIFSSLNYDSRACASIFYYNDRMENIDGELAQYKVIPLRGFADLNRIDMSRVSNGTPFQVLNYMQRRISDILNNRDVPEKDNSTSTASAGNITSDFIPMEIEPDY